MTCGWLLASDPVLDHRTGCKLPAFGPQDQGPALEELRRLVVRLQPDLRDKTPFWKRPVPMVKVGGG